MNTTTVLKTKSSQLKASSNYKKKHPEAVNAYMKEYREKHRERLLMRRRENYHLKKMNELSYKLTVV